MYRAEKQTRSMPRGWRLPPPHTLIVIIWNVLAGDTPYADLGAGFYDRRTDPERETQRLIAKLNAFGHTVTIEPAA
jgi:transposase